jgi:hypothetical protein
VHSADIVLHCSSRISPPYTLHDKGLAGSLRLSAMSAFQP